MPTSCKQFSMSALSSHADFLVQVSFAFSRIESALNYILNHLQELSGLAAEAERLDALLSGGHPVTLICDTQFLLCQNVDML